MLSLGALSSASGAAEYFIKGGEGRIAGYYSEHQEASKWGGGAKEFFELPEGPVDLKTFEKLLDGQVSENQTLGRMVKGERRRDLGRDFTFSAPKSVSLAAIGELEKPILKGFARSVDTSMNWYETNLAQAKVWDNNLGKQVKSGGQKILYASFMDFLSRANDAQLHIHTPVVNLAIGQDNKIRSLNYDMAYKHKILLGNIQRAELAKELGALGLEIRPAGKNGLWELKGSSTELLEQFSKRRQQIKQQAPHKLGDAAAMARITRITRPTKEKINRAVLQERWHQEFKAHDTSIEGYTQSIQNIPKSERHDLTAKTAIDFAISHMSATEPHFDRLTLLKHAMVSVYGHVDIKTMETELKSRVQKGELLISEDGRWLKPEKTHRLEGKLIDELKKGHLKARGISRQAYQDYNPNLKDLTPGQKEAARLILRDKHRFVGVDGVAGTGKTFLIKKTLPALKAQGYDIIGLAPSDKALDGLTKSGVFNQTLTVQKFFRSPRGTSKSVLVIDEAGMVGNEQLHAIMHYSNTKNLPRVVFIGDKDQLPPIEAGRPFELLQDNGLRTARMDDIIRQKKARHVKGVLELSNKQIRQAFQTLEKEIHEVKHEPLETYAVGLRHKMDNPSIIANTNAQCKTINEAIKSEIMTQHNIGAGLTQRIWKPVHLTKAEKMRAGIYEGATHIRFSRNVGKDFKRGEIYRISKIVHDKGQLILGNKNGLKPYSPARHGSGDSFTQVYKQEIIKLHMGDRIKFRRSDKKLGINNNDFGHIEHIKDGKVTIRFDDDKQTCLPSGHRMLGHIDHGWANTAYSFQGVTVKDNIAVMSATQNPLTTLASLYVGSSRHQDRLAIVTDNKEKLLEIISEKLDMANEIISFKEPPRMKEVEPEKDHKPAKQTYERDISKEPDLGRGGLSL